MSQIVYSSTRVPNLGNRAFQNPRHFAGPVKGATKVFIDDAYPKVREAYEAAGVPVAPLSELPGQPKAKAPEGKPATGAEPNP